MAGFILVTLLTPILTKFYFSIFYLCGFVLLQINTALLNRIVFQYEFSDIYLSISEFFALGY